MFESILVAVTARAMTKATASRRDPKTPHTKSARGCCASARTLDERLTTDVRSNSGPVGLGFEVPLGLGYGFQITFKYGACSSHAILAPKTLELDLPQTLGF